MIAVAVIAVILLTGFGAWLAAYDFQGGERFSWIVFWSLWPILLMITALGGLANAWLVGAL